MAVNFVARKCACGGKLEFDPSKKIWICKYCGTIVEREATFDRIQVDGIESISDVVRQTLMDIANKKIESASRNLEDCERKNHKHIGTLLANISFHLANISAAESQDEARGSLDKVKIYAKRLSEEFPVIAEDEINLYEAFGDGASDIYASLIVLFDTLNDKSRVEYISSKLKPEEVFSEHANKSLLRISIKQQKYDVAEAIVNNINHIDKKAALQEILEQYPDNGRKVELVHKLFDSNVADALSKKYFENYFAISKDSIAAKNALIRMLAATEVRCNAEAVAKALYPQMDSYEAAKDTFLALYETKVNDQETGALLLFCIIINKSYEVLLAFFDALLEKKVFVSLNSRSVISFLDGSAMEAGSKTEILNRMLQFNISGKALDEVYSYYLNNNHDPAEMRMELISVLLKEGCPISTDTVKTYVIKTQIDGEHKSDIVKKIFETGISKTYVGDLLSEYLLHSDDAGPVKEMISAFLMEAGFKVDSNELTRYIISSKDTVGAKLSTAKKLIGSGTQIKADCLENYILSLKHPEEFSIEMFQLLTSSSFSIGFQAYSKYLLFCKDIDKARNNTVLINALSTELNSQSVTVTHNGNQLLCNLFQAYLLCANENYDAAKSITNDFAGLKVKLNTEISVNGAAIKFKKYAAERKAELSPVSFQLCEENRMFSLF